MLKSGFQYQDQNFYLKKIHWILNPHALMKTKHLMTLLAIDLVLETLIHN